MCGWRPNLGWRSRITWLLSGVATAAVVFLFFAFEGTRLFGEAEQQVEVPDVQLVSAAAELGDAGAQFELGAMYYFGEDVAKDDQQAVL